MTPPNRMAYPGFPTMVTPTKDWRHQPAVEDDFHWVAYEPPDADGMSTRHHGFAPTEDAAQADARAALAAADRYPSTEDRDEHDSAGRDAALDREQIRREESQPQRQRPDTRPSDAPAGSRVSDRG